MRPDARVRRPVPGGPRGHLGGEVEDAQVDLGVGTGRAHVLTNDLTHAYIDENMGTS